MKCNRMAVLMAVVVVVCTRGAMAGDVVWIGDLTVAASNQDWSDTNNWQGAVVPGANDRAVFNLVIISSNQLPQVSGVSITGTNTIKSLLYAEYDGYSFNGMPLFFTGGTLQINNGGITSAAQCDDNGAGLIFNTVIQAVTNCVLDIHGATTFFLNQGVTELNPGANLTLAGGGTLNIGAVASGAFSGAFTIRGGQLGTLDPSAFANITSYVLGDTNGGYSYAVNAVPLLTSTTGTVTLPLIVQNGANRVHLTDTLYTTWAGNVSLGNSLHLEVFGAGNSSTWTGPISGSGGFVKFNTGQFIISGTSTNTFTGGLNILNGTVILGKTGTANSALGGGNIFVGDGHLAATLFDGTGNSIEQIPDALSVTVNKNGTFNVGTNVTNETINNLTLLGGGVSHVGSLSYSGVGTNLGAFANASLVVRGDLTMSGGATWTVSGAGTPANYARLELDGKIISNSLVAGNSFLPSNYNVIYSNIFGGAGLVVVLNNTSGTNILHEAQINTGASLALVFRGTGVGNGVFGADGLNKTGGGRLWLDGSATQMAFTGGVKVSAGVLQVLGSGTNTLGSNAIELAGGELYAADNDTVNFTNTFTISAPSTISTTNAIWPTGYAGPSHINFYGPVNVNTTQFTVHTPTDPNTYGNITFAGTLTAATNLTIVNNGGVYANTLQYGHTLTLGAIASANPITVSGPGVVTIGTTNTGTWTAGSLTLSGGWFIGNNTFDDSYFGAPGVQLIFDGETVLNSLGTVNRAVQITANGVRFTGQAGGAHMTLAGALTGTGTLRWDQLSVCQLTISGSSNSFSGPVVVTGGQVNVTGLKGLGSISSLTVANTSGPNGFGIANITGTNALGGAPVTVRDGGLLYYSRSGATTNTITVNALGQVTYGQAQVLGVDGAVTINANGILEGSAAVLLAFNRSNSNSLVLATNAIVAHTAPNTATSVSNIGTSADLIYGLGADKSTSLTIGTGTPWAGIGADNGGVNRRWTAGTLTLNSTSIFESVIGGLPGGGQGFSPTDLNLDGVTVTNNGTAYNVNIQGRGRVVLAATNASYAGINKFDVQSGATLVLGTNRINTVTNTTDGSVNGGGALGGIATVIESGGTLAVQNTNAVNGNVTLNTGAIVQLTALLGSGGLQGTNTITRGAATNITFQLDSANALAGAQLPASFIAAGDTVRHNVDNPINLNQINGAVTHILMGASTRTLTGSANLYLNGGTLTEDGIYGATSYGLRTITLGAGLSILVDTNGATFASPNTPYPFSDYSANFAYQNSLFVITPDIVATNGGGAIRVGSTTPIGGLTQDGTVQFGGALPTGGVAFNVVNGTMAYVAAGAAGINDGNINLANNTTMSVPSVGYLPNAGRALTVGSTTSDVVTLSAPAGVNLLANLANTGNLTGPGTLQIRGGSTGNSLTLGSAGGVANAGFTGSVAVGKDYNDTLTIYGSSGGSSLGTGKIVVYSGYFVGNGGNGPTTAGPTINLRADTGDVLGNELVINGFATINANSRTGAASQTNIMGALTLNSSNMVTVSNGNTTLLRFSQVNLNSDATITAATTMGLRLGALNDSGTHTLNLVLNGGTTTNTSVAFTATTLSTNAHTIVNVSAAVPSSRLYLVSQSNALAGATLNINGAVTVFVNIQGGLHLTTVNLNSELGTLSILSNNNSPARAIGSLIMATNTVVNMVNRSHNINFLEVGPGAQVNAAGTGFLTISTNLWGTGQIRGQAFVEDTLSPGLGTNGVGQVGTLSLDKLTIEGKTVDFDLDKPNLVGSLGNNDLVQVNGDLTLTSGTVELATAPNFGAGTYRLFTYTGTLNNSNGLALDLATVPVGFTAYIDGTNTVGQVNLVVSSIGPATLTWSGTFSSAWDFAAQNWNLGTTAYTDGKATILDDTGILNPSINLTTNVAPLSLTVSNAVVAYTIGGSGSINGATSLVKNGAASLTINNSNGFTGGSTFNAGVTTVNNTNGLGTGTVVTANAGTELHFTSTVHIGALTVGTNTTVVANASGQHVIITDGLTIAGGSTNTPAGTVQLHDNSMIVHNGNLLAVRAQIKAARNGGAWNQPGITTDMSASIAGKVTTLGYAQGSDTNMAIGSIHGQAITGTDVVVKYTYVGDANMDGSVDGLDIAKWAVNFTGALGLGATADPAKTWTQGDWNFDGSVDGLDAAIWATNFTGALGGGGLSGTVVDAPGANPTAVALLEGMGLTVVPEPASLVLLGLGGALILGGGRRGRNARRAA